MHGWRRLAGTGVRTGFVIGPPPTCKMPVGTGSRSRKRRATRYTHGMKATDWEFRNRALLFGLIFGLTFPLYVLDRHNAGVAIANWIGPALRMNPHLVSRFLFFIGAGLLATAAFLRTWASSYLRAEVVYAAGVRTESLVADGPYRRAS
jgi:hypothetical protein